MPVTKGKIPNCNSCGGKVWKRDRETFERIGLCLECGLRELEPLAGDLYDAICDPALLVIAEDHGRRAYWEALIKTAMSLYAAGWRTTKPTPPSDDYRDETT